jgi:hypothetical protein
MLASIVAAIARLRCVDRACRPHSLLTMRSSSTGRSIVHVSSRWAAGARMAAASAYRFCSHQAPRPEAATATVPMTDHHQRCSLIGPSTLRFPLVATLIETATRDPATAATSTASATNTSRLARTRPAPDSHYWTGRACLR